MFCEQTQNDNFIYACDYKWHDNAMLDWHHVVQYPYWILIQSSRCTSDIGSSGICNSIESFRLRTSNPQSSNETNDFSIFEIRWTHYAHCIQIGSNCTLYPAPYLMLFINSWSSKRGKYIKLLPYSVHTNAKWFDLFGNWISKMYMQRTKPTVYSPMHPVNSGCQRETKN